MSSLDRLLPRLREGTPLLVAADPLASLRARGLRLDGGPDIGALLRSNEAAIEAMYRAEADGGADVLVSATADTTTRALLCIGMGFRAAALTSRAVDLAFDVVGESSRPRLVAGVLGSTVPPADEDERVAEELTLHAARLSTAGCQVILARTGAPVEDPVRRAWVWSAAVASGAATGRSTWAVVPVESPTQVAAWAEIAAHEGARAVIFEAADVASLVQALTEVTRGGCRLPLGAFLAGATVDPDSHDVAAVSKLLDAGARIVGGGAGSTARATEALARALRGASSP